MVRWSAFFASLAVAGLTVAGCATGPTSKADVCTAFDDLGHQLFSGNGIIGNPLFHQADHLGDVAKRFQGGPSLASDADKLAKIAKSDSTNGMQLTEATQTIASLCGHPLGLNALLPNNYGLPETAQQTPTAGGAVGSGSTSGSTSTTTTTPSLSPPLTTAPAYHAASGPGGLQVAIPAGWFVTNGPVAANLQASDPADPASFVRFGGSPPPAVGLLAEIQAGEQTNPNIRNGYHRLALEQLTFQGTEAVDWEFTFVKAGAIRHARGRYWRAGGYGYVIYASGPEANWHALRPVLDEMANTVTVH